MKLFPRSFNSCSASVVDDSASWRIGTVEALYCRMSGALAPGGKLLMTVWEMATICDRLVWISVPAWKNTFTTATPLRVCDSMCSMSLTVAVMARSNCDTMRPSISSEARPL